MSIIAILLIVYIFYILITENKRESLIKIFTLYCIFSTFVTTGYFIKLGNVVITFSQILSVVIFLFYSLNFSKDFKRMIIERDKRILIILIFFIVIIFNITKLFLFSKSVMVMPNSIADVKVSEVVQAEFTMDTIQKSISLFMFIIVTTFTSYIIDEELWNKIKKRYISFGRFMIIYCLFEFLYNNIVSNNNLIKFVTFIFGDTGSQYTRLVKRGGIFCIQGFNKEPSHVAIAFLILQVIILLSKDLASVKKTLHSVLIVSIMIFSGAFTGALCAVISVIIYIVTLKKIQMINCIVGIGILFLILLGIGISVKNSLLQYYLMRVGNFLGILKYAYPAMNKNDALLKVQNIQYYFSNGGNSGSEYIRLSSILYNLDLFYQNILLGVGLGATNAQGMIPSILANIGIIGSFLWSKVIFYGKSIKGITNKLILIIIIGSLFFIGDIGWLFNISIIMLVYSIRYYEKVK